MKKIIYYALIASTALIFGGCTTNTESMGKEVAPAAVAEDATETKTNEITTKEVQTEIPEVMMITNELDNIDASKDFAPYTVTDIQ